MRSIQDVIATEYRDDITNTNTQKVGESLRDVTASAGLGVALLVAWQHGLHVRHIPQTVGAQGTSGAGARVLPPADPCPFVFVHVPVRQIRRDTAKLVAQGILNAKADPAGFVYHEDGLIGRFSYQNPRPVPLIDQEIDEILRALARQGVLVPANTDNRQIQFKDLAAKRRIEESGQPVYVRVDHQPINRKKLRLPPGLERDEVWAYVLTGLKYRFACNYCSVQVLSPKEVTLNSAIRSGQEVEWSQLGDSDLTTVRNYQFGFTFSPVGDPREVCHFLAWDFPHINDLVINMEPQAYSFSDLIRLVRVINRDVARFYSRFGVTSPMIPISGGCNHWAGSSIYHQHYQFIRVESMPLLRRTREAPVVTYRDVTVERVADWPMPTFVISGDPSTSDDDVMQVADQVAREWRVLSEEDDWSYGNGIAIKMHTQNIFVTVEDERVIAVFIPRHRTKRDTQGSPAGIEKENAGFLEMLGYMVIDDPSDFERIERMSAIERAALGSSWLADLAPEDDTIRRFEENLRICLSTAVTPYEERIGELLASPADRAPSMARQIVLNIQNDQHLNSEQREHLYKELVWVTLEMTTAASRPGYGSE